MCMTLKWREIGSQSHNLLKGNIQMKLRQGYVQIMI